MYRNCLPGSISEFQLFQVFSWFLAPKKNIKLDGPLLNLYWIGSFQSGLKYSVAMMKHGDVNRRNEKEKLIH